MIRNAHSSDTFPELDFYLSAFSAEICDDSGLDGGRKSNSGRWGRKGRFGRWGRTGRTGLDKNILITQSFLKNLWGLLLVVVVVVVVDVVVEVVVVVVVVVVVGGGWQFPSQYLTLRSVTAIFWPPRLFTQRIRKSRAGRLWTGTQIGFKFVDFKSFFCFFETEDLERLRFGWAPRRFEMHSENQQGNH